MKNLMIISNPFSILNGEEVTGVKIDLVIRLLSRVFFEVVTKRVAVNKNTSAILKWCCTYEK